MKIKLNLDTVAYKSKPSEDARAIRVRLCKASKITELTPRELFEAIQQGRTFTPGAMTGTKSDSWLSQQVFVADIDNKCDEILYPYMALEICNEYGLDPYLYYTFSHTENLPKYRVVIIADEPVTDPKEARSITERLAGVFNDYRPGCADTSIKDNARIIFGSSPASLFEDGEVTPLARLRDLPSVKSEEQKTDNITTTTQNASQDDEWSDFEYVLSEEQKSEIDLLECLDYIHPDGNGQGEKQGDYGLWLKVGMALHKEGYSLSDFISWSRRSASFDATECEEKWRTFNSNGIIHGGYIVKLAKENGYILPRDRVKTSTASMIQKIEGDPDEQIPTPTDTAKSLEESKQEEKVEETEPTPLDLLDEFVKEIRTERFKPISTGIEGLDRALSGGFERKTLITLAAAPGMGKTAIAQYVLENMAIHAHPVVYVNLEMDRTQLLSRSISRISHQLKMQGSCTDDLRALEVKRGYSWKDDDRKADIFKVALNYYARNIAPNFYYVTTNLENTGAIDNTLSSILKKITKITKEFLSQGKEAPLICIDYLQFIEFDMYKGKKPDNADAIKQTLNAFKQFAMRFNTVVLMITANNRMSNSEGRASMDSARDTSNIEYSGDVMLSLVYTAVEEKWQHKTGQKDKDGNDKLKPIDNDFINYIVDYAEKMKTDGEWNYPLTAKLVSLKVVKGRSIKSRGVAKFIYDGRYFYYENDYGVTNPYWSEQNKEPE